MDEESFIRRLTALFPQSQDVCVGPGDDCAVLDLGMSDLLLAAVDQVLSGVHYLPDTDPALTAGKLLRRNISDIASMGGLPTHAMLSLALSPMDEQYLLRFHQGMADEAAKYGVSIIGGDMAKLFAAGQVFSLAILGRVERGKVCLRSHARPGDKLYVTGMFGNSFSSGHHLTFVPRIKEARFLAGTYTRAMQDVSDGLLKDAARMAEASGIALTLRPQAVPLRQGADLRAALTDGEDYELLIAVPPDKEALLLRDWNFSDTSLSCLGEFTAGIPGKITFIGDPGLPENFKTGYDHFQ